MTVGVQSATVWGAEQPPASWRAWPGMDGHVVDPGHATSPGSGASGGGGGFGTVQPSGERGIRVTSGPGRRAAAAGPLGESER